MRMSRPMVYRRISYKYKKIISLALPIIGGMLSQNILNLVDTAMVGTLGDAALASVGLGGFLTFMCQAILFGVGTGVQAIVSRRKGEEANDILAKALNGGLLIIFGVGILLGLILYQLVPYFYPYINDDINVIQLGVPYLQIRLLAIAFVAANMAFRGYWNAIHTPKIYMITLFSMNITNIIFNYLLIFGKFGFPELGVTGAAIATSGSTVLGTVIHFSIAHFKAKNNGFLSSWPSKSELIQLIKISLPNGIQQLFFAAGFVVSFWIIGKIGTKELAAAHVIINLTLVGILPGIALGLTAASLVGQSLGRKEIDQARQWGWDVVKVGIVILNIIAFPFWAFPEQVLNIFIHNQETILLAAIPLRIVGLSMSMEATLLILLNSLLGAGDTKRVMLVSISTQWIYYLPIAYVIGPILGYGITGIWLYMMSYRLIQCVIFIKFWRGNSWTHIKV